MVVTMARVITVQYLMFMFVSAEERPGCVAGETPLARDPTKDT